MGGSIKVDGDGLNTLAGQCDTAAAALTGAPRPAAAGALHQATTAAVEHGHALVQAAAAALAGRATSTGTKLRTAATTYASTDAGSGQQIRTNEI
ncbi:type VII secretion target [Mycolicibacterium aubagnense]